MKQRNEIPSEYKWDLTQLFESREAWEKECDEFEKVIAEIPALKGTLGQSAESLYNAYEKLYAIDERFEKAVVYAHFSKVIDGGDPAALEMMSKVHTLIVKMNTAMSFLEPELMAIPEEKLNEFLKDEKLRSKYGFIIENATRLRDHVLDDKGESMMAQFGKITGVMSDVFQLLTNVEMEIPKVINDKGEEAELTAGNFLMYRESKNKEVRDTAFKTMFGTYGKFNNTIAAIYGGSVKKDNVLASLRGYPSARAASLSRSNVPEEVYDALISAVHAAIPTMSKYLKLRKKVMGLDKIDVFDLYTPMVPDVDYPMTYEEACELVINAVAPLGEDYQDVIKRAFKENWIDVYETPRKESGAFSSGVYGVHPFVKLNFAGTLDDAFTLAHELGHSMHSYLSSAKQDYPNHSYMLLVAEVASTCNEVLLTKYLLSTEKDPGRRAYILNHFLEGFRTTVFRQTLFAEFENMVHNMEAEGKPITATALNELYSDLEKTYYCEAEFRDEIKYEWSYIPHFYRAYYVYQYATGFSSAVAIATGILESGDPSKYLEFLSSGGSDYPINELKIAGIDLTSPSVVANAMKVFDETIDELDALLSK